MFTVQQLLSLAILFVCTSALAASAAIGERSPMTRLVYIAHRLGAGEDRERNRRDAARWVAWAATQGVAPVATWITLSGEWDESQRELGLQIDVALVRRCDEIWLCGPVVSPGMRVELEAAERWGLVVRRFEELSEEVRE